MRRRHVRCSSLTPSSFVSRGNGRAASPLAGGGGLQLIECVVLRRRVGRTHILPISSSEAASARRPQSVSSLTAVYTNRHFGICNCVARPDAGSLKRRPTLFVSYVGVAGAGLTPSTATTTAA